MFLIFTLQTDEFTSNAKLISSNIIQCLAEFLFAFYKRAPTFVGFGALSPDVILFGGVRLCST